MPRVRVRRIGVAAERSGESAPRSRRIGGVGPPCGCAREGAQKRLSQLRQVAEFGEAALQAARDMGDPAFRLGENRAERAGAIFATCSTQRAAQTRTSDAADVEAAALHRKPPPTRREPRRLERDAFHRTRDQQHGRAPRVFIQKPSRRTRRDGVQCWRDETRCDQRQPEAEARQGLLSDARAGRGVHGRVVCARFGGVG